MGTAFSASVCGCTRTTTMGFVGDGAEIGVTFCQAHYDEDPAGCDARIVAAAVVAARHERAAQETWAREQAKPGRHV